MGLPFSCREKRGGILARYLLLECGRPRAARRTFAAVAELPDIDPQFIHGAAEGVAMHPQLAGSAALVALVFFQHSGNEPSFKFAYGLRIENIASVHLLHECFELIFH